MNIERDYDYILKLLLVGDMGTGKSCVLSRYCDDEFSDTHQSTIGVDFKVRSIDVDGKIVKMQLWDTAGQERFRTVTTSYYRGAHGVFIFYDVTSEQSFRNLDKWIIEIDRYTPYPIPKILVGNKIDLSSKRVVDYERAKEYAIQRGLRYIETSAKYPLTGQDIGPSFEWLCSTIIEHNHVQPYKKRQVHNMDIVVNIPKSIYSNPDVNKPKSRCYC
jgi:Ras-related protein Rab-1A